VWGAQNSGRTPRSANFAGRSRTSPFFDLLLPPEGSRVNWARERALSSRVEPRWSGFSGFAGAVLWFAAHAGVVGGPGVGAAVEHLPLSACGCRIFGFACRPAHSLGVGEDGVRRSLRFVLLRRGEDVVDRHPHVSGRARPGWRARERPPPGRGRRRVFTSGARVSREPRLRSPPPAPGSRGRSSAALGRGTHRRRVQARREERPRGVQKRTQRRDSAVPAAAPTDGSRARAYQIVPDLATDRRQRRARPPRRDPRTSCRPGETEYSAPTGARGDRTASRVGSA
jgi:hypothetical protein